MGKSADAFRTISEVADWLDTPAHVLRFWESKFSQVKPVKRAGGRRYYRPADMQLLGGIKKLLHDDGMTIKGVQKLLRDQGVKHVSDMAPALDDSLQDAAAAAHSLDVADQGASDGAQVLDFTGGPATPDPSGPITSAPPPMDAPREPELFEGADATTDKPEAPAASAVPPTPSEPETMPDAVDTATADEPEMPDSADNVSPLADPPTSDDTPGPPETPAAPIFSHRSVEETPEPGDTPVPPDESAGEQAPERAPEHAGGDIDTHTPVDAVDTAPKVAPADPKPHVVDLPDDPPDHVDAGHGALSTLCGLSAPRDADTAKQLDHVARRLRGLIKA